MTCRRRRLWPRLLPALGRGRQRWSTRAERRAAVGLLPEVLSRVPPQPGFPPPGDWRLRQVVVTQTDTTVMLLSVHRGPPVAVVRVAGSAATGGTVHASGQRLTELHADDRLAPLHRYIPRPLGAGVLDGWTYAVEEALPGRPACTGGRPPVPGEILLPAATLISELHARSAASVVVESTLLDRWTRSTLNRLRQLDLRISGPALDAALSQTSDDISGALLGHPVSVSWTHGDYWCGNVLVAGNDSAITGIMDWDAADPGGLPVVDLMHLLLTTRSLAQGVDIGVVVRALLAGERWSAADRQVLAAGRWAQSTVDPTGRAIVLVTWLSHIGAVLDKYPGHIRQRPWLGRNVESVLLSL